MKKPQAKAVAAKNTPNLSLWAGASALAIGLGWLIELLAR